MGDAWAFDRLAWDSARRPPRRVAPTAPRGRLPPAAACILVAAGLIGWPQSALPDGSVAVSARGLTLDLAKLGTGGLAAGSQGLWIGPTPASALRDARFRPAPAAPRPRARPFVAEGPLAARLSAPFVRPLARPATALFRPQARPGDLFLPDPPRTLAGATDLQCLAVAIYHEARGQSLDGQLAIASVILNRAREPQRWGARPCEIVVPGQFSFLSPSGHYPPIDNREAWAIAVEMAREALERGPSALVGQADHYHTASVHPRWQDGMERVIRIGDHVFYADASARG